MRHAKLFFEGQGKKDFTKPLADIRLVRQEAAHLEVRLEQIHRVPQRVVRQWGQTLTVDNWVAGGSVTRHGTAVGDSCSRRLVPRRESGEWRGGGFPHCRGPAAVPWFGIRGMQWGRVSTFERLCPHLRTIGEQPLGRPPRWADLRRDAALVAEGDWPSQQGSVRDGTGTGATSWCKGMNREDRREPIFHENGDRKLDYGFRCRKRSSG